MLVARGQLDEVRVQRPAQSADGSWSQTPD
jgi:hypothetical protein